MELSRYEEVVRKRLEQLGRQNKMEKVSQNYGFSERSGDPTLADSVPMARYFSLLLCGFEGKLQLQVVMLF